MLRFAICDDNKSDLTEIAELLKEFLNSNFVDDYHIELFQDGCSLLLDKQKYDLIILDIQLTDTNGICIAQHYMDTGNKQNIILVSSTSTYMKDGYRVNALRYITKPINKKEMFIDLKNVLSKVINGYQYINDETICTRKLYIKDIPYIEVQGRKSYIIYNGERCISKKQLKIWETDMRPYGFVRSHNSFLVNLIHVYDVTGNFVILKSKEMIPLSRKYKKNFKEAFFRYIGDMT